MKGIASIFTSALAAQLHIIANKTHDKDLIKEILLLERVQHRGTKLAR